MAANFLTLDRDSMIKLVFNMLNLNMSKAWAPCWDDICGVKHYSYEFADVNKIVSMVSEWNNCHDHQDAIFCNWYADEVEQLDEVRGVTNYSGEIVRVYIEDDHFTFPA